VKPDCSCVVDEIHFGAEDEHRRLGVDQEWVRPCSSMNLVELALLSAYSSV